MQNAFNMYWIIPGLQPINLVFGVANQLAVARRAAAEHRSRRVGPPTSPTPSSCRQRLRPAAPSGPHDVQQQGGPGGPRGRRRRVGPSRGEAGGHGAARALAPYRSLQQDSIRFATFRLRELSSDDDQAQVDHEERADLQHIGWFL